MHKLILGFLIFLLPIKGFTQTDTISLEHLKVLKQFNEPDKEDIDEFMHGDTVFVFDIYQSKSVFYIGIANTKPKLNDEGLPYVDNWVDHRLTLYRVYQYYSPIFFNTISWKEEDIKSGERKEEIRIHKGMMKIMESWIHRTPITYAWFIRNTMTLERYQELFKQGKLKY